MSRVRSHATYANVVATLALFLALGMGGAWAADKITSKDIAKSAVTSKAIKDKTIKGGDVKDGQILGIDIGDGSLGSADLADGSVGAAAIADGSIGAAKIVDGSIGAAKILAGSIGTTEIATDGVGTAEIANGQVGAADLSQDEPYRLVGAAGQPGFGNGGDGDCLWSTLSGTTGGNPVSFYRDNAGRVHLVGVLNAANGGGGDGICDVSSIPEAFEDFRAFTLPVGYRPANPERHATVDSNGNPMSVTIGADEPALLAGFPIPAGDVLITSAASPVTLTLDGLDFRAAEAGGFP